MKINYIVFSLIILTRALCWGAANNANLDRRILSGLSDTMVSAIAEQADLESLSTMAQTDPHLMEIARYELVSKLLKKHNGILNAALFDAAQNNYLPAIAALVELGANVNATNAEGRPALEEAAMEGHNGMVNLLLDLGANIDQGDSLGRTPLMGAAIRTHETTVELLLRRGAQKDLVSTIGDTAKSMAENTYPNDAVIEILENWEKEAANI